MNSTIKIIFISFVILLFTGCATNRGEISLEAPLLNETIQSNGESIYINSVEDYRVFEIKPKSPNIPSLKPGENMDENIKARAIARKRNSFGAALGDILLKDGQTVNSVIRTSVKQAFLESGYTVIDNKIKLQIKL